MAPLNCSSHHGSVRVLLLDVEVRSEELLRQLSYATKNQLGHPKPPKLWTEIPRLGGISCPTLVLFGIRAPIIGE